MSALVPPHNEEAEASVLGAVLLSDQALGPLVSVEALRAEHFYRPRHQTIYRAMVAVQSRGEHVDALTVAAELGRNGTLEKAGGEAYVHSLPTVVPAVGAFLDYARIVLDHARLRTKFDAGRKLTESAARLDHAGVADAEALLSSVAHQVARRRTPDERREAALEIVEGRGVKWRTPYNRLNELLAGGFRPGQLTTIAGWSSHGKSVLLKQLIDNFQHKQDARCAIYTNEMETDELDVRDISRNTEVPYWRLVQGQVRDQEWKAVLKAIEGIGTIPVIEAAGMTADEIAYDIRRERWDIVGVDLLNGLPNSSETKEIDANVKTLAAAARQSHAHIFACQHLNQARATGHNYPPEPARADIRGSGQIYDLSNNVLFVYLKESDDEPGERSDNGLLKLDKARGAIPGRLDVKFQPNRMRFLPPLDEGTVTRSEAAA